MAIVTVNGHGLLEGAIILARRGNWRADLVLSTDGADLEGAVVIDDNGAQFVGVVESGGVDHQRWRGRVVGGNGAIASATLPRFYRETTAGIVLADLIREAGERLSAVSDPRVLAYALPHWFRFGNLDDAVEALVVDKIRAEWRVLRDGSVWVGFDTFPSVDVDAVIEDRNDDRRLWVVATDRAELEPGTSFEGREVVQVVHRYTENGLRTEVSLGG